MCAHVTSDAQLISLCQYHLQDWHESRGLAEVAVADDVCVDVEAVGVGARLDAPSHIVQAAHDGWRKLGKQWRWYLINTDNSARVVQLYGYTVEAYFSVVQKPPNFPSQAKYILVI